MRVAGVLVIMIALLPSCATPVPATVTWGPSKQISGEPTVYVTANEQGLRVEQSLRDAGFVVASRAGDANYWLRVDVGGTRGTQLCGRSANVRYILSVQRKRVLAIKGRGATGACNPNIFDDMSGLLESHFGGSPPVSAGVARQRAFAGTCFAVSPDGFVLTNHHVVEDLSRFSVRFENGAEFKAEVWASNPLRDLALVRFDGPTPAYLSLANDSSVALGDEVFTLGYPASNVLGVNVKYGDGTVSALSGPGGEEGWLQVSVPVHPGNSGSPLVDGNGEVVGIIVGSVRAASFFRQTLSLPQDINFAIKAHYAKSLFDEPEPMPVPRDIIEHVRTAVCAVIPRR